MNQEKPKQTEALFCTDKQGTEMQHGLRPALHTAPTPAKAHQPPLGITLQRARPREGLHFLNQGQPTLGDQAVTTRITV